MQPARRRNAIIVAIFGVLALLNLLTRDYLGAAGWALVAAALWLREGAGPQPLPRWRVLLGNAALGGAILILVIMAVQLARRIAA